MDRKKFKLAFLLLAAAIPLSLAAIYFDMREESGTRSTTNRGELIIPVLDITEFGLHTESGDEIFQSFEQMVVGIELDDYVPRPWVLMYLGTENCDSDCEQRMYYLRQLHVRLSSESDRVERYYVNTGGVSLTTATRELFIEEYPDLIIADSDAISLLENLERTVVEGINPINSHYIYVVDPVGNVMLYFTEEDNVEDIYKDLDKLLDQSSLG